MLEKSNDKCRLKFIWKTSLVCPRKMVEFENSTCIATIRGYTRDFVNGKQLLMTNMLNTNYKVSFLPNKFSNIFVK